MASSRHSVIPFLPEQSETKHRNPSEPSRPQPSKSFRKEYPFLDEPTCPPELKILAANKITAYRTYRAAHARLFDCSSTEEQLATVRELVEAFIDNRAIYDEFAYYARHKSVLGVHPVFKEYQEIRAMRKLTPVDLYKKMKNLEHAIWRLEKQLKQKGKEHLRVSREKILESKKQQLAEVERLLNL